MNCRSSAHALASTQPASASGESLHGLSSPVLLLSAAVESAIAVLASLLPTPVLASAVPDDDAPAVVPVSVPCDGDESPPHASAMLMTSAKRLVMTTSSLMRRGTPARASR